MNEELKRIETKLDYILELMNRQNLIPSNKFSAFKPNPDKILEQENITLMTASNYSGLSVNELLRLEKEGEIDIKKNNKGHSFISGESLRNFLNR
jgi:hypothetical protein